MVIVSISGHMKLYRSRRSVLPLMFTGGAVTGMELPKVVSITPAAQIRERSKKLWILDVERFYARVKYFLSLENIPMNSG